MEFSIDIKISLCLFYSINCFLIARRSEFSEGLVDKGSVFPARFSHFANVPSTCKSIFSLNEIFIGSQEREKVLALYGTVLRQISAVNRVLCKRFAEKGTNRVPIKSLRLFGVVGPAQLAQTSDGVLGSQLHHNARALA